MKPLFNRPLLATLLSIVWAVLAPGMAEETTLKPSAPVSSPAPSSSMPSAVKELMETGDFPEALLQEPVVSRAALASVLIKLLDLNPIAVNQFPVYLDVLPEDTFYNAIETVRERRLMHGKENNGLFQPDRPASRQDVCEALAKVFPPPTLPLTAEETDALVAPYREAKTLLPAQKDMLGLLLFRLETIFEAGFWPTPQMDQFSALALEQPVTPLELARIVSLTRQALNLDLADARTRREAPQKLVFAANRPITVTPLTSLFQNRLSVGDVVYFTTVETYFSIPSIVVPKGAHVRGKVTEFDADSRQFIVTVDQLRLPDDKVYAYDGKVVLVFPPDAARAFVVPGQLLQLLSLGPALKR